MEQQTVYLKPVTLKNIFKFAVPTIAMTVFMSFYTMVDGLFVSNLIGTNALSAINLTYYSACHRHLYHACHWRQRSNHEKNGRTENKGSERRFYLFNSCQYRGRVCDVWSWLSGNGSNFCRYESVCGCS